MNSKQFLDYSEAGLQIIRQKMITVYFLLLSLFAYPQATGVVINDMPSGGSIGTAAATVDVASTFNINQTTSGQTISIPDPTNTSGQKNLTIRNIGSTPFTLNPYSINLVPNHGVFLQWMGSWYAFMEVDGDSSNEIEVASQGGNSGKFLTTDGSVTSWATALTAEVDGSTTNEIELPSQSSQSGKFLSTNGSSPSWQTALTAEVDGSTTNEIELPTQTGQSGKVLSTNGSTPSWIVASAGTVTSVTAGTGLSGGTITNSGTISLPNVGTAGTYSGITTDAQGRAVSGTTRSINNSPGRSIVTTTSSTGFQISNTRDAVVNYEGNFQTTTTIGGPSSITVFLETADTNSTTPGDWTTIGQQVNSSTATLAVAIQIVDTEPWSISRTIPAGKYVRIRSGSITGTASASINSQQQETLQ